MSKVKVRLITILSFVLLAALALGVAFGMPYGGSINAETFYSPTSIFAQGTGGDVLAPAAEEGETSYITFSFRNEGSVYYRRNLALKWFEADKPEAGDTDTELTEEQKKEQRNEYVPGKVAYFSMSFAFAPAAYETREAGGTTYKICPQCGKNDLAEDAATCSVCSFSFSEVIHFSRYEILFESAEENISKAAKSTNSIVFVPGEAGALQVGIKNAAAHAAKKDDAGEEDDLKDIVFATIAAEDVGKDITISFGEGTNPGEFAVQIKAGENAVDLGENNSFTNIGGNFLEYRSSASTTPSTPITFKTELAPTPTAPEGQTRNAVNQRVTMKSMNKQGFVLESDGRVKDTEAAVLVVNEEVYAFTLGQRYSLSTEAIDVCDDSVSVVRSYYMVRKDDGAETVHMPAEDDYGTLTTSTYFMPSDKSSASEEQSVSIRYILRDGRLGSDSEYDFVYLAWYAAKDAKEPVIATHVNGEKSIECLRVIREKEGPYYIGLTANESTKSNDAEASLTSAAEAYQTELKNIASDEKTSAGKGAYFYLPSLRGLIASDYADYRNLRFNIYYKKENSSSSASSETSLRYNNLRFQIDTEGRYSFKVMASDASGAAMKLYVDGELVDVTSSNIWDIDEIPTFTFDVIYTGADIEEPGEQDTASRGSLYNISDFEIIDLGDSIKEYELYYFNTEEIPADEPVPTYSEFVENAKEYVENTYAACLDEIELYNDEITEDDEEAWNNSDNAYLWDPDSALSFVPQKSGFYIVKLMHYDMHKLGDDGLPAETVRYQVIEARNPYDYIPTRTDWFANNVTSVVLFSISAVLAVIIVILFVVKPSDKRVEEVDLEKLKGTKKK